MHAISQELRWSAIGMDGCPGHSLGVIPLQAAGMSKGAILLQPFGIRLLLAVCGVAMLTHSSISSALRLATPAAKPAARPLGDRYMVLLLFIPNILVSPSCSSNENSFDQRCFF